MMKTHSNRAALWSEFFGTFALIFCGTGAVIIDGATNGAVSHAGIALTFGLVVMALIYTFGEVSGAHFNPAVTLAFWAAKRFEAQKILPYFAAQFGGAIAASLLLKLMFPAPTNLGATMPRGSALQSLLLEIVLTWFLMLVILSVSSGAKEKGITAGIAIGAVVGLEAMFAGPISGASMNPARSLAPALVSLQFHDLWIYFLGPILGALLAVPTRLLTQFPTSILETT
ncbi:aquaporin Z [Abditibacterium utsteinense]|uniref:Aquaporin Z n=1 Tax=Abditibacterium utsteinense TaxID=1960156 RepID=A0A2S8SWI3_9BACT|nr:MIP family channel protein [Abditibacterium utsteinense]PQV65150.1 aquaporin Z [Abditibacterium utsteinense]